MKIGIIGNMNNGNFSIMRYFRDLGFDAHLLLYSNDGKGNSNHFRPECDSWEIKKWNKFIVRTLLADDPINGLKFPLNIILFIISLFRRIKTFNSTIVYPINSKYIRKICSEYDYLIGSGLSPAFLKNAGIPLTIYYPYSMGIEWLGEPIFLKKINSSNIFIRKLTQQIRINQTKGILNAKNVICLDKSITAEAFNNIGINPKIMLCPMVYNKELQPITLPNDTFNKVFTNNFFIKVLEKLNKSDFSVISHARNLWHRKNYYSQDEWKLQNKHNDWLIFSFSKFIQLKIVSTPLLILFDYGEDVKHTQDLIVKLDLEKYVVWMPKLERKQIMWFISKVDVGIGEFYELPQMLFGGTGYEILSMGLPLIQGFNFPNNSFTSYFNIPEPPLLPVKEEMDVFKHLVDLAKDKNYRKNIGQESKKWFDQYCGIGLAEKWVDIIRNNTI